MRRCRSWMTGLLCSVVVTAPVAAAPGLAPAPGVAAPVQTDLSSRHREWLEMVTYIVEKDERRIFEGLSTEWQRDRFIEAFWKRRDPEPVTPENEFRFEYERRWEYVNDVFGRDTPVPGWRTDRGRVYLANGPPFQVHPYPNTQQLWPLEVWEYRDAPRPGMPSYYQIIFFKPRVFNEWRLYSPAVDGPTALVIASPADLDNIDLPALASKFPMVFTAAQQAAPGLGALGSEALIARTMAPPPPPRPLALYYSASGEVETAFLTAAPLEFDLLAVAFPHPDLEGYVDVTLEMPASTTTFIEVEDRVVANYQIEFEVETEDAGTWRESGGNLVVRVPLEERDLVQEVPIQFTRRLWLLAGSYRLRVLLTEVATHRIGTATTEIRVPERTGLVVGPPELFYVTERRVGSTAPGDGTVPVPWVGEALRRGQPIGCLVRVLPAATGDDGRGDLPPDFALEYRVMKDGTEVWSDAWQGESPARLMGESRAVVRNLHLEELPAGRYELEVRARLGSGAGAADLLAGRRRIELVDEFMPVARLLPAGAESPGLAAGHHLLGQQLLRRNEFAAARSRFELAVRMEPRNPVFQVDAAKTLVLAGEFAVAEFLLIEALNRDPDNPEVFATLGLLRLQTGEFSGAIEAYGRALDLAPGTPAIYNGLAEAYLSVGEPARAMEMLDLSLEINSGQHQVRELRARLARDRSPGTHDAPR